MSYDFSLDRKKIILAFTSSVALVILIFIAGWMSGIVMSIQKPIPAKPKMRADQRIRKPRAAISSLTQKKTAKVKAATPIVRRPIIKGLQAQKDQPVVAKAPETSAGTPTEKMAFSVQAGVFLGEKNVEDIVADLKGRGYEPYTFETTNSRNQQVYAVRIGDYADLEEASRAVSEFKKKEKMSAIVTTIDSLLAVAPEDVQEGTQPKNGEPAETSKETQPTQRPSAQKTAFTVQIGSFVVKRNASKLADDLKGKGYEMYILKTPDSKGRLWYVVQIGGYADWEEASQVASEFTKKEKIVAVVMPIASYLIKERKDASSLEKPEDAQSGGAAEEAQSGSAPKDAQPAVKSK